MSYVIVLFITGMLIFIHELGHYAGARIAGIPVATLSLGFGPALIKKTIGQTEYRLSVIPIGGYLMPKMDSEEQFFSIHPAKRILLSAAGPLANVVLGLLLFALYNAATGNHSLYALLIQPFVQSADLLYKMAVSLPQIFEKHESLSGIVGIVSAGGTMMSAGLIKLLGFTILMTLNLALFNMLPLPALDGGKIILYLAELIMPKSRILHLPLSIAGWVLIMGLMIYATVLDVGRIIS